MRKKSENIRTSTEKIRIIKVDGHYKIESENGECFVDVDSFLGRCEIKGLSPQTIRAYAFDLLSFFRWWEKTGIIFSDLTQSDLFSWIAHERELRNQAKTINRRLGTAFLFYEFITGNPMPKGKHSNIQSTLRSWKKHGYDRSLGIFRVLPHHSQRIKVRVPLKELKPLDPGSVGCFFSSVHRYRDLSILSLLLFCRLRSAEVRNIKLKDIHYYDLTLRVFGKGSKERIIPIPEFILKSIDRYIHLERPSACPSDHVFVVLQGESRGKPMTAEGFRTLFRYRRQKLGISDAHPHRFRHTFGAELAKAGVALTTIRKLMGHGDIQTTMQYISLSVMDIRDEYDRAIGVIRKRYDQTPLSS